jgi:hypothetical protein
MIDEANTRPARPKHITGGDQFTEPLLIRPNESFIISIYGANAWNGNLRFQRSWDKGVTWHTVQSYTGNKEDDGVGSVTTQIRVGCPSGDYTEGDIKVYIERSGVRTI